MEWILSIQSDESILDGYREDLLLGKDGIRLGDGGLGFLYHTTPT